MRWLMRWVTTFARKNNMKKNNLEANLKALNKLAAATSGVGMIDVPKHAKPLHQKLGRALGCTHSWETAPQPASLAQSDTATFIG
jgi:arginine/ornithine N-succinyltransferase beta subunit